MVSDWPYINFGYGVTGLFTTADPSEWRIHCSVRIAENPFTLLIFDDPWSVNAS